jgi:hypothetical protein
LTEQTGIVMARTLAQGLLEVSPQAQAAAREAFGRSLLARRVAQLLEEADDAAAEQALGLVLLLPDESMAGLCQALARVTHRERRRAAIEAMMGRGNAGTAAIAGGVRDADEGFALDLLGGLGKARTAQARRAGAMGVLAGVAHRSARVRFESLRQLLASLPPKESLPHAIVGLADTESPVRRVAEEHLIQTAPAEAAPALEKLVRDAGFRKRELGERRRLLLAYGRTGGTPAVKLLIDILERRRKDCEDLRGASAEVLAILGAKPAQPVLERIAGNKKEPADVRTAAGNAARAIAAQPKTLAPRTGPPRTSVPAEEPRPAQPVAASRPAVAVERPFETPSGQNLGPLPVSEPGPLRVVGTPRPPEIDEVAVVAEEPLWEDEPPARKPPPPEIAALLQEYLMKTDPAERPTPPPAMADPEGGQQKPKPTATLAAVKLKRRRADDSES